MSNVTAKLLSQNTILSQLQDMQTQIQQFNKQAQNKTHDDSEQSKFVDHLYENIQSVNDLQINADRMAEDLITGKSKNIHETMLAATQAELSFNLMVQVRNKVLEAYQEIMHMQI